MKKILLILSVIVPFCINAQNINDVYNISATYYQGTAKSMAMGNAMGAVGQDFSSISINPAGLALFRKPSLVFTPALNMIHTRSSDLNSGSAYDFKTNLSINNIGIVGVSKIEDVMVTWGIGMNRTNNFNNSVYVDVFNESNSLIDAYFAEIIANDIYNDDQLYNYSPSYIYPIWKTELKDFHPDGSLSSPVPMGGLTQRKGVNSWGGTNEYTLSLGANISDKLYLGFSANLPYVNNRKVIDYEEDFSTSNYNNYWIQEEAVSTSGWGINGKLGLIVYPARWIRIGASFHTPTLFSLTDMWRTETYAHIDEYRIYQPFESPTSYFNYSMITPWKANGSLAFIFGNYGMITADYEYVDFSSVRLSANGYDYRPYNDILKTTFAPTMNIRLGTEWRHQNYCFRGGYAFYGSPYGINATDYRRNALSCGFGYTKHAVTIDFAYVYTLQTHDYNLYSQYTNYYNEIGPTPEISEITRLHSLVVSFKFRMY